MMSMSYFIQSICRTANSFIIQSGFIFSLLLFAQSGSTNEYHDAAQKALDAMQTLQRNGGWAMSWAADDSLSFGEYRPRKETIIVVQPPATPGIASVYLHASNVLKNDKYLQIAITAGDALITGQHQQGGFPHEFYPDEVIESRGTFDDNVTQGTTNFLIDLWQATKLERFKDAAIRAADFMLAAQYPNGGFPQAYPLNKKSYSQNITLNDNAMVDVIRTLIRCHDVFGEQKYYDAAIKGVQCLVDLRSDPPQAGWAQQYTPEGEPAPARTFEPVGLTTSESTNVLKMMVEIYQRTGDKNYLEIGMPVFAWMENSRLDNGKWARLYELGTNKAIYSTADGEVIYDVSNARPGYGWQGNYYNPQLKATYQTLLDAPADQRNSILEQKPTSTSRLKQRADESISSLDQSGFWFSAMRGSTKNFYLDKFGAGAKVPPLISSRDFVIHTENILNYLERINSQ